MKSPILLSLSLFAVISFGGCREMTVSESRHVHADYFISEAIAGFEKYGYYATDIEPIEFSVVDSASAQKAFKVFCERFPRGYDLSENTTWIKNGEKGDYYYWIGEDKQSNFFIVIIKKGGNRFHLEHGGPRYSNFRTTEPNQAPETRYMLVTLAASHPSRQACICLI